MRLRITTTKISLNFDGPYAFTTQLAERSGVYAISVAADNGSHVILDIGESQNVKSRVQQHDRKAQWVTASNGRPLYCSAFYCNPTDRLMIETHLREFFSPPCGIR